MSSYQISTATARRLALRSQLLTAAPRLPRGAEGVAGVIEHLGYIQVDTIAVVERAHHHTLWTRRADYSPAHLHQLQAVDRRVFEYYAHAASYVPIADYRFYLPRMERFRSPTGKWEKARLQRCRPFLKPVLERIRAEGPLTSKDFDSPSGKAMWHRKPTTAALETLHLTGELMISARRNFERVYDLTERVLPPHINTSMPSVEELGQFYVRRALRACGVADEQDLVHHIGGVTKDIIRPALKVMIESKEIVSITLCSDPNHPYYALASTLSSTTAPRAPAKRVLILSPFDNLIILRNRLKRLFGFDYTLECYVPASRRIHGYFVLPLLYGDEFVGRLDAKADRAARTLLVRRLVIEQLPRDRDHLLAAAAARLRRFAAFTGCDRVRIEHTEPRQLAAALRKQL